MNSPRRIVLISPNYPPTPCGIGDYTQNLANHLADSGLSVSVVSWKQQSSSNHRNVEVVQPFKKWNALGMALLGNALRKLKPDLVHLQWEGFGYKQSFLLPALL